MKESNKKPNELQGILRRQYANASLIRSLTKRIEEQGGAVVKRDKEIMETLADIRGSVEIIGAEMARQIKARDSDDSAAA